MSFGGGRMGVRPGEYTKVNQETEVRIPKLTYVAKSIVFMIINVGLWVIVWLIWARVRAKTVGYWRWFIREWTSWFALEWPWFVITLILCWIGPSAVAYLYRLFVEQIVKQTPQYTAYPAERGRWKPFKPDPIEYDMFDAEAEAVEEDDTVDVNLTAQPKGSKRPQIKVFPKFPNGKRERAFYKAVGAETAAFSEGGAAKHRVSQRQFRKIRDALIKRKCADWKNKRRHKDGVDLFDSGRGLLKARGR